MEGRPAAFGLAFNGEPRDLSHLHRVHPRDERVAPRIDIQPVHACRQAAKGLRAAGRYFRRAWRSASSATVIAPSGPASAPRQENTMACWIVRLSRYAR